MKNFACITGQHEQGTGTAPSSRNNTGASAETAAVIGNTESSDDSGGEDEVESTPTQLPMEKHHPEMLLETWCGRATRLEKGGSHPIVKIRR